MTVKELREKLTRFPEDMEVRIFYEGEGYRCWDEIGEIEVVTQNVAFNGHVDIRTFVEIG